jgi:propionate CoA-transferase
MELSARKICGRRGSLDLYRGSKVNLGIGMPDAVAGVLSEEGVFDKVMLSVETGVFGGIPVRGVSFGASINPEAICQMSDIFDFYDGGGLDIAFLGLGEVDEVGNVNVSFFGNKCTGPGGFINITQNTRNVVFLGTFRAGNFDYSILDGKLIIENDAPHTKFLKRVKQITFSGRYAVETGQKVTYITERAVFRLVRGGIELIEIAPGIDVDKDILSKMDFCPLMADNIKIMDSRIFEKDKMNLRIE